MQIVISVDLIHRPNFGEDGGTIDQLRTLVRRSPRRPLGEEEASSAHASASASMGSANRVDFGSRRPPPTPMTVGPVAVLVGGIWRELGHGVAIGLEGGPGIAHFFRSGTRDGVDPRRHRRLRRNRTEVLSAYP